jgi:hypothetical protein
MTDSNTAKTTAAASEAFTRSSPAEADRIKKRGEQRRALIRHQNTRSKMK